FYLFFFSSRRRHTRFSRDWSSDVCSSDLNYELTQAGGINPWTVFFDPNTDHSQRFGYDYEEQINYAGIFTQLEYSKDNLSAFFQGALSNQSHVRTEFLNVQEEGESEEGDKVNN